MELSKLQNKILLNSPDRSIIMASAASGKTRLLTEKVRQLINNGVEPSAIAVITFTNLAASELKQRLAADYKTGLFIGTIHALANFMLCSHGYDTKNFLNEEKFDMLFQMINAHPDSIRHYQWVLLDEAQDTSQEQFEFIFDMINPTHFFVCGDLKQSIYQWRDARPDILKSMAAEPSIEVFDLNENYRNGSAILSYAKGLIQPNGLYDTSIPMRDERGFCTSIRYNLDEIASLVKSKDDYSDWCILCRTNTQIEKVSRRFAYYNIPIENFHLRGLTIEQLNKKMQADTAKVLTVHAAKGLEWKNVIVIGVSPYGGFEERNLCYVAATRARDNLYWVKGGDVKKKYR